MTTRDHIKAALEEAIRFARGEDTGAIIHTFTVEQTEQGPTGTQERCWRNNQNNS